MNGRQIFSIHIVLKCQRSSEAQTFTRLQHFCTFVIEIKDRMQYCMEESKRGCRARALGIGTRLLNALRAGVINLCGFFNGITGGWISGHIAGLILGLRPANERRRCFVTPSLIGVNPGSALYCVCCGIMIFCGIMVFCLFWKEMYALTKKHVEIHGATAVQLSTVFNERLR